MKNKKVHLPLPFLIPLLLLTACGQKPPENDGKIILRYLAAPDVGGFSKEIIQSFEAANPDIRVEMVEGPSATNLRQDLYAASFMAKEDTYDLIYMDLVWLPKFADKGWLKPLDDFFDAQMQKEFFPGDLEGSRYQGKLYRVPAQSDGGMLYYRKDLLEAAGINPPQTWADLASAAQKLQSPPERWGFVFQGKQYEGLVCNFLEMLWGNGGELMNEQGKVTADRPEAVEALRWMADAVQKIKISPPGVLTYQEEEARHMFQEGKAVFMRNWPYAWNLLQEKNSPVRGKVGIIPMARGPKGKNAATLGGWGFGISAFSKNPEAAWKFIRYASSPENQKIAYFKGGILPSRPALFKDPEILKASPHLGDVAKVLAGARPRPMVPKYPRISDTIQVQVSAALSGQKTPEEALAAAASEIRAILK